MWWLQVWAAFFFVQLYSSMCLLEWRPQIKAPPPTRSLVTIKTVSWLIQPRGYRSWVENAAYVHSTKLYRAADQSLSRSRLWVKIRACLFFTSSAQITIIALKESLDTFLTPNAWKCPAFLRFVAKPTYHSPHLLDTGKKCAGAISILALCKSSSVHKC